MVGKKTTEKKSSKTSSLGHKKAKEKAKGGKRKCNGLENVEETHGEGQRFGSDSKANAENDAHVEEKRKRDEEKVELFYQERAEN